MTPGLLTSPPWPGGPPSPVEGLANRQQEVLVQVLQLHQESRVRVKPSPEVLGRKGQTDVNNHHLSQGQLHSSWGSGENPGATLPSSLSLLTPGPINKSLHLYLPPSPQSDHFSPFPRPSGTSAANRLQTRSPSRFSPRPPGGASDTLSTILASRLGPRVDSHI